MDTETTEIEEIGEIEADKVITPYSAIQSAIFDLCHERARWKDKHDPHGILPWINKRIAALELAQKQLRNYRKLREALAVLREVD